MIRSLWVGFVGVSLTIYYSLRAILLSLFTSPESAKAIDHCGQCARRWARGILKASGVRVRVEGLDRIDPEHAQVMVSNHESWFDVFVLAGHLPLRLRFVAKKELARIPLFGRAWQHCGHVSVDRGDRNAAITSLEEARNRIHNQHLTILMFPEGTRSRDGKLHRFKKGAFVLALQAGVPVVPVAVTGTRDIMPKGRWRVRPGEVVVHVGEPIAVEGFDFKDRDRLTTIAYERVAALRGGGATETKEHGNARGG